MCNLLLDLFPALFPLLFITLHATAKMFGENNCHGGHTKEDRSSFKGCDNSRKSQEAMEEELKCENVRCRCDCVNQSFTLFRVSVL